MISWPYVIWFSLILRLVILVRLPISGPTVLIRLKRMYRFVKFVSVYTTGGI